MKKVGDWVYSFAFRSPGLILKKQDEFFDILWVREEFYDSYTLWEFPLTIDQTNSLSSIRVPERVRAEAIAYRLLDD